jgi:hypothetical protein
MSSANSCHYFIEVSKIAFLRASGLRQNNCYWKAWFLSSIWKEEGRFANGTWRFAGVQAPREFGRQFNATLRIALTPNELAKTNTQPSPLFGARSGLHG